MSRKFKLVSDYHEEGVNLYKKKTITLKQGVTVLVGCNGIGKTTLLRQLKDSLKKENIPYIEFDNLKDGGSSARSQACYMGNFNFLSEAMCSSEGENIVMNISQLASRLGNFVKTGEDRSNRNRFAEIFSKEENREELSNERWILLDAVDSGLSVDNIVNLKEQLFATILEHNFGTEIYIVISANEYELARNEQCFDVYNGKYVKFKDYEEYRDFILESRNIKNSRYE